MPAARRRQSGRPFPGSEEPVLQPVPRPRGKLLGVESARGVAACLVVFYHAARHVAAATEVKPFGSLTQFGHAGVDFFFVLSGFIILYAHGDDLGRPDRAGRYIERRVTRVFPVYWAVLAVTLALGFIGRGTLPAPLDLLRDILLLPWGEPTVGVAWTLQFEVVFYTAFLVLILNRAAGRLLFAAWLLLIAAALAIEGRLHGTPLALPADAYSAQFFMGMVAAYLLRRPAPIPAPGWLFGLGLAGFLLSGMAENLGWLDGYAPPARFAYGLSAMVLLIGLVALERQSRLRLHPVATEIGSASYAIYLMHLLGIGIAWKLLEKSGLAAMLPGEAIFLLLAVAGILSGMLGHRLVERPLLAISRGLLARHGGAQRATGPSAPPA